MQSECGNAGRCICLIDLIVLSEGAKDYYPAWKQVIWCIQNQVEKMETTAFTFPSYVQLYLCSSPLCSGAKVLYFGHVWAKSICRDVSIPQKNFCYYVCRCFLVGCFFFSQVYSMSFHSTKRENNLVCLLLFKITIKQD